jgi:hypothetical protein
MFIAYCKETLGKLDIWKKIKPEIASFIIWEHQRFFGRISVLLT